MRFHEQAAAALFASPAIPGSFAEASVNSATADEVPLDLLRIDVLLVEPVQRAPPQCEAAPVARA
jgi:hypothetical protein